MTTRPRSHGRALLLLITVGLCTAASGQQASEELTNRAEQGDAEACYELGLAHAEGREGEADLAKAFEWFQKAALLGHHQGWYRVGLAYFEGEGTESDDGLRERARYQIEIYPLSDGRVLRLRLYGPPAALRASADDHARFKESLMEIDG